jgi:hypothetical protein
LGLSEKVVNEPGADVSRNSATHENEVFEGLKCSQFCQ